MSEMWLSILGLYHKDPTIFDNMVLPEGVDRQTLIDKLLTDCAELEIVYPSTEMMKLSMETWSKAHLRGWEIMFTSLNKEDYDPFTDFDRHENFTETYENTDDLQGNRTGSERAFNDDSLTNVSGLNNNELNKTTGTRSHTLNQYGNSALGTNQDIIRKEILIRQEYNIIDIIISDFKADFCICVY